MPPLDAKGRALLPDSAFAYIDSRRRRRLLPIHDEAHVRNALARFNQVVFENEAARDRARKRLLTAAKRYGIVPIGFITGQVLTERSRAGSAGIDPATLPSGFVTFLLADIERSTDLLRRLGDGYAELLAEVRAALRRAVRAAGGHEVDARADEFFAAFSSAPAAVRAAVEVQLALRRRSRSGGIPVAVRVGLHSGRPSLSSAGYIGLAVNTVARVAFAAHGGQILASQDTMAALEGTVEEAAASEGVAFRRLGAYRLAGLPEPQALFQVEAADLATDFPPPRQAEPAT